jgi:predicted CXXCH cytochrome family protein
VAKNECFACHSPHRASSDKLNIEESSNELCYRCHKAKKYIFTESSHAEAEGIVGKGLCINCHEPHSAGAQPLLRKSMDKMCTSCHKRYKSHHFLGNLSIRKDIKCIKCHKAHGGSNRASLKVKMKKICKTCHRNK